MIGHWMKHGSTPQTDELGVAKAYTTRVGAGLNRGPSAVKSPIDTMFGP
jgi:hypothetical protein